jgi:phenylalanyl-tRNA synthetase alpha chain
MIDIDIKALKEELGRIDDVRLLEEYRIKYLGKQGLITKEFQSLAKLASDEKKALGERLNQLKLEVSFLIDSRIKIIEDEGLAQALSQEAIDVTLPGREKRFGGLHPVSYVSEEIISIFAGMGFTLADGPDVDTDYHNFTALNFPKNHPAKEMHDTFYVNQTDSAGAPLLLRTHTSTVQIREMKKSSPPFKFISVGKVYRRDYDATHTPMFQQVEGVYIDKHVSMAHMKSCLYEFIQTFFAGNKAQVRFRPSFFPFVEPGGEVDIRFGDELKWLEILGCGMVHSNVLKNVGIDPEIYQGFAFGMGIERCAMLKYKIDDCRECFEGDIRWLQHYGFKFFRTC